MVDYEGILLSLIENLAHWVGDQWIETIAAVSLIKLKLTHSYWDG